jgi:hypothetical protein
MIRRSIWLIKRKLHLLIWPLPNRQQTKPIQPLKRLKLQQLGK